MVVDMLYDVRFSFCFNCCIPLLYILQHTYTFNVIFATGQMSISQGVSFIYCCFVELDGSIRYASIAAVDPD